MKRIKKFYWLMLLLLFSTLGAENKNDSEAHLEGNIQEEELNILSLTTIYNYAVEKIFDCLRDLERSSHLVKFQILQEFPELEMAYQNLNQLIFGNYFFIMGHTHEETVIGSFGEEDLNANVRISFINGILTTNKMLHENLSLISQSHGNTKVHYVFRPTEGWVWDITRAIMIKVFYYIGFRSKHAHLLADHWKKLIQEMGGIDGGGVVIHYAHSLGGSETDRARNLLTPEEQKMIRVITLGSPTFLSKEGFQSVINYASANDGVTLFDPLGHFTHWLDENSNVFFHGTFGVSSFPLIDHCLDHETYTKMMHDLGQKFLEEFSSDL
ncbi:MAG: hypothetical protein Q8K60_06415 [Parachlamydiaceae bacterium]|nr:hypothetical protein [Parachlamydiaceae bacterium]